MSENLKNFKLLGQIKKGQFMTISSKGDFGEDNFLDITMKKDKNSFKNDIATAERYIMVFSALGTASAIVLIAHTVWKFV